MQDRNILKFMKNNILKFTKTLHTLCNEKMIFCLVSCFKITYKMNFAYNNPTYSDCLIQLVEEQEIESLSPDNKRKIDRQEVVIKEIYVNSRLIFPQGCTLRPAYDDAKEVVQDKYKVCKIQKDQVCDCVVDTVLETFQMLYTKTIANSETRSFDDIISLLHAANFLKYYDICTILSEECAKRLVSMDEHKDKIFELATIVSGLDVKHYRALDKKISDIVLSGLKDFNVNLFAEYPPDLVILLLRQDNLLVSNENVLVRLLFTYINHILQQTPEKFHEWRTHHILKMILALRLEYCTKPFLANLVGGWKTLCFVYELLQRKERAEKDGIEVKLHSNSILERNQYASQVNHRGDYVNKCSILWYHLLYKATSALLRSEPCITTKPRLSMTPEDVLRSREIKLDINVLDPAFTMVVTNLFYIDGFSFILEASKSMKEDKECFGLFLFSKDVLEGSIKIKRSFDVYSVQQNVYMCLNETVSTFSNATSGFGMYDLFRKPMSEVFKEGSPYLRDGGILRLRARLTILD